MILGKGQIFGEESIINESPAEYTVRCISAKGVVLMINELEFNKKVKCYEDAFRIIQGIKLMKL